MRILFLSFFNIFVKINKMNKEQKLIEIAKKFIKCNPNSIGITGTLMLKLRGIDLGREIDDLDLIVNDWCPNVVFPKDLEFEKVGDHHVFYSDTDMNGHMTNSNYPDMVWNYIPDVTEKEVTSVNIRFMKEAPMDSDLEIFMARPELALSGDPMAEDLFGFKSIINDKTNIECLMGVRPVQERIYY